MSLIRLTEPGWEHYSGPFADIEFKDGLATKEWPESFTDRIASALRCEDDETGEPLGVTHRMISQRAIEMAVAAPLAGASAAEVVKVNEANREPKKDDAPKFALMDLTGEELDAIASKDGIGGLRKIADPFGIKGRSIQDLLDAIVKYRDNLKPVVADAAVENQAAPETPAA